MSSEVQAKWMNSAARASARSSATRSRSQYSIAFTSWLVSRLDRLDALGVGSRRTLTTSARSLRAAVRREKRLDLGDARLGGERDQPLDLDRERDRG